MSTVPTTIVDLGSFKIAISPEDEDISRQILANRWYVDEKFETTVFSSRIRPGMKVLDIGGNIGFYAMLARSIVGKNGHVVTFEPFPASASLIRSSIQANNYTNLQLVEAAVSDREGEAELFLSPDLWTEHSLLELWDGTSKGQETVRVPLVTVDQALERLGHGWEVDFIKMDIEGAESRALPGMHKVLLHSPNLALMTEFWPNGFLQAGSSPEWFLKRLRDLGFTLHHINSETEAVEPTTVEDLLELTRANSKRNFENPVMKAWGWYTNLLCLRAGGGEAVGNGGRA